MVMLGRDWYVWSAGDGLVGVGFTVAVEGAEIGCSALLVPSM
jgi:hypothetical protein